MKSKHIIRKLFNSLSFPVFLIDRNYVIVEFNSAAGSHLTPSYENIAGRSCFEVAHGLDEPCWHMEEISCPVKKAFETGERAHAIHRHRVGGHLVVEEIIATPLDEGDGDINYVVEEFRDVTSLLELREGILSVCAVCKKIRDEKDAWHDIERYIHDHTGADF